MEPRPAFDPFPADRLDARGAGAVDAASNYTNTGGVRPVPEMTATDLACLVAIAAYP